MAFPPAMFGFVGAPLLPRQSHVGSRRRVAICTVAVAALETHDLDGKTINGPLVPAGNNILVKIAKASETTAGGLILSTGTEKPNYGTAVAVGPGKYFPAGAKQPMKVDEGDTVMYGKFGGQDLKFDGEKHTIVTQDDLLCKLENGTFEASSVRPLLDYIFVKVDKPTEELKSGLLVAPGSAEKPTTGTVTAVGTGRIMENGETEPIPVNVGDKVLYGKYAGSEIKFDRSEYIFVRVSDIFAHWSD